MRCHYNAVNFTASLNAPHSSSGSYLHYVIYVQSLFVTLLHAGGAWRLAVLSGAAAPVPLVAATLRWPALGSLWGREPRIGICGCPIRVALGWGTAAVIPVLAATTTCPVARVRFHSCFIVKYFLNMFICIACVKWVPTNTYVFMSTRFSSGLKYPGLAFLPLVPHICVIVLGYLWFR